MWYQRLQRHVGYFIVYFINCLILFFFIGEKDEIAIFYNALTKQFSPCFLGNGEYTFYISANIPLKELCAVNYQLFVPVSRLRLLKLYHYFKDELVLPGYDGMKFVYYVKKIKKNESDGCDIEVHVENRKNVEIEGLFYCKKCSIN